jgi:putative transposase
VKLECRLVPDFAEASSGLPFRNGSISAKFLSGGTYFFTVTLADRSSTALTDHIAPLRTAFRITRKERPFAIDAVVVLPDHLHAVLTLPLDDADFSGRWRRIKSLFTRQVVAHGVLAQRDSRGEYALWQRRFWEHTIRDEADFARHVDYIHYNPIKHGYVASAIDWPHSSFHRYVKLGALPKDWAGTAAQSDSKGFGETKD